MIKTLLLSFILCLPGVVLADDPETPVEKVCAVIIQSLTAAFKAQNDKLLLAVQAQAVNPIASQGAVALPVPDIDAATMAGMIFNGIIEQEEEVPGVYGELGGDDYMTIAGFLTGIFHVLFTGFFGEQYLEPQEIAVEAEIHGFVNRLEAIRSGGKD